jgi:hypothetical protein
VSEDTIRRKLSVIERRECAICGIPLERGRCPDDARHKRSVVVRYVPEQQLQGAIEACGRSPPSTLPLPTPSNAASGKSRWQPSRGGRWGKNNVSSWSHRLQIPRPQAKRV